jgi:cytochrome c553
VAVDAGGLRAYVALQGADSVVEVSLDFGAILREFPTGREPNAVALSHGQLCVSDRELETLLIPLKGGESRRLPIGRLPSDAQRTLSATTPNWMPRTGGRFGFFGSSSEIGGALRFPEENHTPAQMMAEGPFQNDLFVSHTWMHSGAGFAGLGPGRGYSTLGWAQSRWLGTNSSFGNVDFLPLDVECQPAALPTSALYHPGLDAVFVSASGSNCLLQLNGKRMRDYLFELPDPVLPSHRVGPPRPQDYVERRIPLPDFPGPMALSADGKTLVIANMLADSITVLECEPTLRVVRTIVLGTKADDPVSRGERLFHSASLSKNGQFACASCHPGGDSDRQVWNMPFDDNGPRLTKSLLGVGETAPYGWHGEDATLEIHVRKTLTGLFQHEPTNSDMTDLMAYLRTFAVPKGNLNYDPAILAKGEAIFRGAARCSRCHPAPTFQDGGQHDVDTGGVIDTPSLRGVGSRWRLMHDGSKDSIHSATDLTDRGPLFETSSKPRGLLGPRHGNHLGLTDEQKSWLLAYLRSL